MSSNNFVLGNLLFAGWGSGGAFEDPFRRSFEMDLEVEASAPQRKMQDIQPSFRDGIIVWQRAVM